MKIHDYLVVGSGCSGAIAAQTLIEKGAKVTMLDTGITKDPAVATIPDEDFITLRKTDSQQYRYLIGNNAEGITWGKVGKGEQITPPRKHITESVDRYIPLESDSFSSFESLSYGGLGTGWGLQCWEYSPSDLQATGLNPTSMARAYQWVGNHIGISATDDDASKYTLGKLKGYQPSPRIDRNHDYILQRYQARSSELNHQGFYLGRTPLALITESKDTRKPYAYHDMDFYSDNDLSAWRPWITVNNLHKHQNFQYYGGYLVESFAEKADYTEVRCMSLQTNKKAVFRCRKLILATGALGSARIVLRSIGQSSTKLPLLCNPYSYVPCLQPRFFGKAAEPHKLGFTQLSLFFDQNQHNTGASVASLYSYQSLMLFRLIRHVPLDFRNARRLMQYVMSGMVIMGIHHPDISSSSKYLQLVTDPSTPTGDKLQANYSLRDDEVRLHTEREKQFIKAMRQLGTYGLKKIDPGYGASIHYAGTLPFSTAAKPFTLNRSGKLYGTKSIYVADSSGFRYLPAPGLTFSLMANAHLVAEGIFKHD